MNVNLVDKDKRILELLKNVSTLIDIVNRLNSQLEDTKLFIMQSYQSSFNEAIRQAQHIFDNKDLDYHLLDPTRFLVDILGGPIGPNHLQQR